jgi:hypothetical protein
VDFFIPENCAGALQPLDATPHTVFASTGAAAAMSARKMNAVEARAMAREKVSSVLLSRVDQKVPVAEIARLSLF